MDAFVRSWHLSCFAQSELLTTATGHDGSERSVTRVALRGRLKVFPLARRLLVSQVPLIYLVLLRLFFGYYFLRQAVSKLRVGWLGMPIDVAQPTARPVLATILDQFAHANPYPPYKRFLLKVVIPRADAFRYLIVFGEMAIGISLLSGTLTRLGALFGIFANFNYLAMKGLRSEEAGIDQAFIAGLVVTLLSNPGRVLGVDAELRRIWPRFPLW